MTGEDIMYIARGITNLADELDVVGLSGGEERVSDEVIEEAMALVSSIRRAGDELDSECADRALVSDPDRKHDARREEALFEKREKNSN